MTIRDQEDNRGDRDMMWRWVHQDTESASVAAFRRAGQKMAEERNRRILAIVRGDKP